ncbi:MAG: ABC transporter permease [Myxococcota bacterium]
MLRYVARKLLLAVPLVICIVTLIFTLVELSPGDISSKYINPDMPPEVAQMIIDKYQLDRPAYVRYFAMMRNLAMFDFGNSMAEDVPVFEIILRYLPNTILLSFVTLLVAYPMGVLLGTIQAVRQNQAIDTGVSVTSLLLYSMPSFWLALMLQLLFGIYWTGWLQGLVQAGSLSAASADFLSLPLSGMKDPILYDMLSPGEQLLDRFKHLLLPGFAMGLAAAASSARYMRSSLLEVIRQDYIRTARAKGLPERLVIIKHGLRNALLPIVTLLGLSLPYLFSGSVLVEMVFSWPGMGRMIVNAIYSQDTPLIIASFFIFTLLVVAGNLIADILYAWVDPRIRLD